GADRRHRLAPGQPGPGHGRDAPAAGGGALALRLRPDRLLPGAAPLRRAPAGQARRRRAAVGAAGAQPGSPAPERLRQAAGPAHPRAGGGGQRRARRAAGLRVRLRRRAGGGAFVMRRLLVAAVFAAVLGTGIAHGLLTDRWAAAEAPPDLDRLPLVI